MKVALFDLDGTLVDSDAALLAPFDLLGVTAPPLGLPLAAACELVGITVDDYVSRYDATSVVPFPGVVEMLSTLPTWGVASNKLRAAGVDELARLGLTPAHAFFSDDFDFGPKSLDSLLAAMGISGADAVYVGDTDHDRRCAAEVGATFALAGWNPRAEALAGDVVLASPADLSALLT